MSKMIEASKLADHVGREILVVDRMDDSRYNWLVVRAIACSTEHATVVVLSNGTQMIARHGVEYAAR